MSKFFDSSRTKRSSTEPKNPSSDPVADFDQFLANIQDSAAEQVRAVKIPEMGDVMKVLQQGSDITEVEEPVAAPAPPATSSRKVVLTGAPGKTILNETDSDANSAEAYRRLRTRLITLREKDPFRSVAITSAVKGEGKTLTALNLSISLSRLENFRVLLVDADLRTHGISLAVKVDEGPGLNGILEQTAAYEKVIAETNVPNLFFLNAGPGKIPASELYAGAAWKEFAARAAQDYDLVIYDAPPILPVPDFDLIGPVCDRVVFVARTYLSRLTDVEKAMRHVDNKKLAGVVLNGSKTPSGYYSAYGYGYGEKK